MGCGFIEIMMIFFLEGGGGGLRGKPPGAEISLITVFTSRMSHFKDGINEGGNLLSFLSFQTLRGYTHLSLQISCCCRATGGTIVSFVNKPLNVCDKQQQIEAGWYF